MSTRYIGVIDETGSSRPTESGGDGFGIGLIYFLPDMRNEVISVGKKIGMIVGKVDYKYKHVQKNAEARRVVIDLLASGHIRCYGFFTAQAGIAQEIGRAREAVEFYGGQPPPTKAVSTYHLLEKFLGYAIWPLLQNGEEHSYTAEVFWDRRNDMVQLAGLCRKWIDQYYSVPNLSKQTRIITFRGPVTGDLSHAARLAGVVAGDIRKYFEVHGLRIWNSLDQNGLKGRGAAIKCVATFRNHLADADPLSASEDTVLLQGYYKAFLQDGSKQWLISFCDRMGHYGALQIRSGRHWRVSQLAD